MISALVPPDVEKRFYDDRIETIPFDEPTDWWRSVSRLTRPVVPIRLPASIAPRRTRGDGRLSRHAVPEEVADLRRFGGSG